MTLIDLKNDRLVRLSRVAEDDAENAEEAPEVKEGETSEAPSEENPVETVKEQTDKE